MPTSCQKERTLAMTSEKQVLQLINLGMVKSRKSILCSEKNFSLYSLILKKIIQTVPSRHSKFSPKSGHLILRDIKKFPGATSCDLQASVSTLNVHAHDRTIRTEQLNSFMGEGLKKVALHSRYNKAIQLMCTVVMLVDMHGTMFPNTTNTSYQF